MTARPRHTRPITLAIRPRVGNFGRTSAAWTATVKTPTTHAHSSVMLWLPVKTTTDPRNAITGSALQWGARNRCTPLATRSGMAAGRHELGQIAATVEVGHVVGARREHQRREVGEQTRDTTLPGQPQRPSRMPRRLQPRSRRRRRLPRCRPRLPESLRRSPRPGRRRTRRSDRRYSNSCGESTTARSRRRSRALGPSSARGCSRNPT